LEGFMKYKTYNPNCMIQATGFVTAGGRSTRMGRDKAFLKIGSRAMIEYVIEALRPVTSSVAIIANNNEYKRFGLPVFADTNTGIGPLEAIRTALANSSTPFVVLAGCDMPFLTSELFSLLLEIANEPETPASGSNLLLADANIQTSGLPFAVIPLNESGKPEPLCAVYSTKALPMVNDLITRGIRKVSLLFEQIPSRFVSFEEIKYLQNSVFFFENINTPQDFQGTIKKNIQKFQTPVPDAEKETTQDNDFAQ
jgi:molybdopterin-guanine dinucleotide biosynthesis protein A